MTDDIIVIGQQPVRTFEILQYISGPIECESMDDLPANLQDVIFAALERKAHDVGLPLAIVAVRCDKDIDSIDETRVWFLHIVASEIVVADSRTVDIRRLQ